MKIAANPNRMELLRLRRRLALARRGHKLLKDKLEEMMRRFLDTMRRLSALQAEASASFDKAFLAFALVRGRSSPAELEQLLPEGDLELEMGRARVLNLAVPEFRERRLEIADYDLRETEAELDVGVRALRRAMPLLLEIAGLWKAVELLAGEIELTRRRVNALEHILIPGLRSTIRAIASRLEEMERSTQVQLMRVKEIVRGRT